MTNEKEQLIHESKRDQKSISLNNIEITLLESVYFRIVAKENVSLISKSFEEQNSWANQYSFLFNFTPSTRKSKIGRKFISLNDMESVQQ